MLAGVPSATNSAAARRLAADNHSGSSVPTSIIFLTGFADLRLTVSTWRQTTRSALWFRPESFAWILSCRAGIIDLPPGGVQDLCSIGFTLPSIEPIVLDFTPGARGGTRTVFTVRVDCQALSARGQSHLGGHLVGQAREFSAFEGIEIDRT